MGTMTTGSFAKFLKPGVDAAYGLAYKEHPVEHTEIFDKNNSSQAFEEEIGLSGFGLAPVKTEGSGIEYDEAQQGFIDRYTHITYALGFIITREMYEDGMAEINALKKAKALAFSIRQTKETVAANVLNRAFNSSYTYGDGVELCSLLHPNVAGGTWQNEPTTDADLSEAAIEQACLDIADFKSDRGLQIAIRPLKLIVPAELQFDAQRILFSDLRVGTANNDSNALRQMGAIPQGFCVNHYLTDADAWFIKTDCPDGLKYFERRADKFDTENDWDTENAKFKSSFRGSWGCTDKRAIYGCTGAA
jgi:hypothetical protein